MIEFLKQPWAWYVAGPLIGLTVPALLILGNKTLGISSSLRHVCAMCMPAKIPFFSYDWKKEAWNLFFLAILIRLTSIPSWLRNLIPMALQTNSHYFPSSYLTGINCLQPRAYSLWY